jgi:2-oxoglutarate dehydrogenase E2 component (dihydrolipoamide succinyltransferase)
MAKFELKLPKMGESVAEATITNWLKKVGDTIEMDEAVLEIATDKVDSEVPSEVAGTLVEILFNTDDVVQVGQTIAIIETEGGAVASIPDVKAEAPVAVAEVEKAAKAVEVAKETVAPADFSSSDKFFSPLVKNIAKEEGISLAELESIAGSGKDGRVNKEDLLNYIKNRGSQTSVQSSVASAQPVLETKPTSNVKPETSKVPVSLNGGDEIVEMDRMRKLISGYMVASVQTSAHVQSFIEVDVTNIVKWRDKVKNAFEKREGEKLTFTPIFMEAVAKALKDFPGMNISVDGEFIIKRKNIN